MGILILITAGVFLTTFVATVSAMCSTNKDCPSVGNAVSDLRFCDREVNICQECSDYCGPDINDVHICHQECRSLCERLQGSGTREEREKFPTCWKKLATTPIPTEKPTPGPQQCLDNQDVCTRNEFCDKASNSCSHCNVPCGKRGSNRRCQKLCPELCKHVVSKPRKHLRRRFPHCLAIITPTPFSTTPVPQTSRTSSTTDSTEPQDSPENEPVQFDGANRRAIRPPFPNLPKPDDEVQTGQSNEAPVNKDYGQITIYVLAPLCGIIFIVCAVQIVVIVRRRRTLGNGGQSVRTDVMEEASGAIPLQDMGPTSCAAVETVVMLES